MWSYLTHWYHLYWCLLVGSALCVCRFTLLELISNLIYKNARTHACIYMWVCVDLCGKWKTDARAWFRWTKNITFTVCVLRSWFHTYGWQNVCVWVVCIFFPFFPMPFSRSHTHTTHTIPFSHPKFDVGDIFSLVHDCCRCCCYCFCYCWYSFWRISFKRIYAMMNFDWCEPANDFDSSE